MKLISNILFAALAVMAFFACNENEPFEGELYKKVIYVLSSDNNNVFAETHFLDQEISNGHLTVYAGGTKSLDKDVTVTFEKDNEILGKYNAINFDLNTEKYAKELDSSRFEIPSYSTTITVGSENPYTLLPIKVRAEGLSPDSTYFIPLKIKSVSEYEVNPERSSVLYRIYLANQYTKQVEATQYSMKGDRTEPGKKEYSVTLNKRVFPLTKTKVRTTAGIVVFANNVDFIDKNSMILDVNENTKKIVITSYKPEFLEIKQIGGDEANYYGPDFMGINRFYIQYQYRTRNSENDEWSGWITMKENMRRVE